MLILSRVFQVFVRISIQKILVMFLTKCESGILIWAESIRGVGRPGGGLAEETVGARICDVGMRVRYPGHHHANTKAPTGLKPLQTSCFVHIHWGKPVCQEWAAHPWSCESVCRSVCVEVCVGLYFVPLLRLLVRCNIYTHVCRYSFTLSHWELKINTLY